jgi:transposase-like protein
VPRSYPPEFRRKVLDLLAAGRSVTEVAEDLGISGACIYNWRKQDWIDRGDLPGLSSAERAELLAARLRINTPELPCATGDESWLLRLAQAPAVGTSDPPRVADGSDHQGACRLA